MENIDRIDRRLLALLQEEGRMTTVELAERIGLSPTAASERIKRLQRDGVILGYTARLSPEALGRGFLAFVEVTLDKTTPDVFERFSTAVGLVPAIIECHMVAGGFDYLVKVRVADMAAYRRLLGDVVLTLPGVHETRTYAVMEEVKSTDLLPI